MYYLDYLEKLFWMLGRLSSLGFSRLWRWGERERGEDLIAYLSQYIYTSYSASVRVSWWRTVLFNASSDLSDSGYLWPSPRGTEQSVLLLE